MPTEATSDPYVDNIVDCVDYLTKLNMRVVVAEQRSSPKHWMRRRARGGGRETAELEALIRDLDHASGARLIRRLAQEPDLVPLLHFTGTGTRGFVYKSWGEVPLRRLGIERRLVLTTYDAYHLCAGGWGALDLWAWQAPAPSVPLARWGRRGRIDLASAGNQAYGPPFALMSMDRLW